MNGQLNSSLATENAAFAKIKALSKKVDNLEQDTIANKEEIDALDNELYELSSKQNYNVDTLTANSIDVNSSAVVNSLTCESTITSENVNVNNTLNVDTANITNLSSVNSIDAVNVNADKLTANNITCVEGFTSNKNEIVVENISDTLNVNGTSNFNGQVNVSGNMTFTKDSGNSILAGDYLEVQAKKIIPDNLHFDTDKTGPEQLPSITGKVAIDGVIFENTTPKMSVTDFAASDANITNATIDDAVVKNITVTETLNMDVDSTFTGNVDVSSLSFKGVEHSGETATTALGINGDGHLVINDIIGGGAGGDVATEVQNTKFYTTNFYNGGQPAIQLDTSFVNFSMPTYITMLKLWEQQYDGRYDVDFYRWHEIDLDNEGLKISSIDSDQEHEYLRKWNVIRQLLLDKDSATLVAKRDDTEDKGTNYESSIKVDEDKIELKRTYGVYTGTGQPVPMGSLVLDNSGLTLSSRGIYGVVLKGDNDSYNVKTDGRRVYLRGDRIDFTLDDHSSALYVFPKEDSVDIHSNTLNIEAVDNLNITASKVTVNGGQYIHGVWFDKILTDDNYTEYLASVTEDEETIYLDMTKQLWITGYIVLKNKTIYAKEWWLLKDEYPNDEYMPDIASAKLKSRIGNICLSNCTVIGCKVLFTTSPEVGKYCLDKDDKFIDCYVYKENWTSGLVDDGLIGQLIETPDEFPIFEHSNLRLDYTTTPTFSSIGFPNSKNSKFNLDINVTTLTFTKDGNNVYKVVNTHPTVKNEINYTLPTGGYERQE